MLLLVITTILAAEAAGYGGITTILAAEVASYDTIAISFRERALIISVASIAPIFSDVSNVSIVS